MSIANIADGSVACVTGGANGIGLAAAKAWAERGLTIVIVDTDDAAVEVATEQLLRAGASRVASFAADVSEPASLKEVEVQIAEAFGGVDVLMNNAGIQPGSDMFGPLERWQQIIGVNLWGVIHGSQIFAPRMIERGRRGMIINTGSKQGITTPPGDPCYNVTKAGVKAFTEALAHELRNTAPHLSAHLLIPGFVFTALNAAGRTERPDGAWTPEQNAAFMMESLERGDFYILCPDNDVPRALDEKRMAWAIGDVIENRPALSRWHPDYAEAFESFVKG